MAFRRIALGTLAATAACGTSTDAHTEAARQRILALAPAEAQQIVAFCAAWHQPGALLVSQFPAALPVPPTSASATAGELTFAWWNNSHAEEDRPHPGFELVCSDRQVRDGRALAPGLWYRDAPTRDE